MMLCGGCIHVGLHDRRDGRLNGGHLPSEEVREVIERVRGMYAMRCPLYRTLHNAIRLTSSYTLVRSDAPG